MSIATALPAGLAFIMFAIGLGLTLSDFTRVFRQPRGLLTGLGVQLVMLPLMGAGLVALYPGRPEFAFGIMVLAACPGGITSNLLTLLAGGNTALSVSMTAITSLAGMATVPLVLGLAQQVLFGESQTITLPLGQVIGGVFGVTAVPMIAGMALNRRWPATVARLRPWFRHGATAIFALIVVGAFVGQGANMMTHFADVGPFVLTLNLGTMAAAMAVARALRLPLRDGIAVTLEGGLQNAALAIFIAVSVMGQPAVLVPAIIYALLMNLSAAGFIAWARTRATAAAGNEANTP